MDILSKENKYHPSGLWSIVKVIPIYINYKSKDFMNGIAHRRKSQGNPHIISQEVTTMTKNTVLVCINSDERNDMAYAMKVGLLKMLFNPEFISEQHYFNALSALYTEAKVVAA